MDLTRRSLLSAAGVAAASAVAGCGSALKSSSPATVTVTAPADVPVSTDRPGPDITDPAAALSELKQGNQRFVDAKMLHPDQNPQARQRLSATQKPFAVLLSCSDSRLPPEVIFDQGLGDLFVVRVAGNIIDRFGMGSIEYAVAALGAPLVMVLGHQKCGAVKATLDSLQPPRTPPPGDIAALVDAIAPAVGVASARPGDLLDNSIRANAELSRDAIERSPQLKKSLDTGALQVVAAYYSLDTGLVTVI